MNVRRLRGSLLRLTRRRTAAVIVGLLLAVPAAYLEFSNRFGAWWVDELSLVLGGTGVALIWSGLSGARPDYVDNQSNR